MDLKGQFRIQQKRDGKIIHEEVVPNTITNAGKDDILDVMFDGGTQNTSWYIGLIDNAGFTGVAAADTHDSHSGWTENTDYDESNRPEWAPDEPSSQEITNSTARDFTMNASVSIEGIFISSSNTKGSTSSSPILWSAATFGSTLSGVTSGDVISVTYEVNA